jgi:hypothetical protein
MGERMKLRKGIYAGIAITMASAGFKASANGVNGLGGGPCWPSVNRMALPNAQGSGARFGMMDIEGFDQNLFPLQGGAIRPGAPLERDTFVRQQGGVAPPPPNVPSPAVYPESTRKLLRADIQQAQTILNDPKFTDRQKIEETGLRFGMIDIEGMSEEELKPKMKIVAPQIPTEIKMKIVAPQMPTEIEVSVPKNRITNSNLPLPSKEKNPYENASYTGEPRASEWMQWESDHNPGWPADITFKGAPQAKSKYGDHRPEGQPLPFLVEPGSQHDGRHPVVAAFKKLVKQPDVTKLNDHELVEHLKMLLMEEDGRLH